MLGGWKAGKLERIEVERVRRWEGEKKSEFQPSICNSRMSCTCYLQPHACNYQPPA